MILGVLSYLKETFTHTPSYDMSPAMLSVLVKMMLAQAQESVFEKISLPGIRNEFFMLVKVAQEAAKVRLLSSCDFRGWAEYVGAGALEAAGAWVGGFPRRQLAHHQDSVPIPAEAAALCFLGKYQCFRYGSLIPSAAWPKNQHYDSCLIPLLTLRLTAPGVAWH